MRILAALFCFLLCMNVTGGETSPEADPGDAEACYRLGVQCANRAASYDDFSEAARWYRLAAAGGHAKAQRNLATLYDFGLGVYMKLPEAAELYILAAGQGDLGALLAVANMYATGRGAFAYPWRRQAARAAVMERMAAAGEADPWALYRSEGEEMQDDANLVKMVRLRAARGDFTAQAALGMAYETGFGVKRDPPAAVQWFRKAAEKGDIQAMNRMGGICREGVYGVERNDREAFEWFGKAAEKGHSGAKLESGQYHYLLQNYDRSFECFAAAAEAGSAYAAERAVLLLLGHRLLRPAVEWSGKAVAMGGMNAHFCLFMLHGTGVGGLERNMPLALEHLTLGFAHGSSGADPEEMILPYLGANARRTGIDIDLGLAFPDSPIGRVLEGILYEHGVEREQNQAKAMELYKLAAEDGAAYAQYLTARLYDRGGAFAAERRLCVEWYEKSAAQGYGPALYRLGVLFRDGDLVEKSPGRARECFKAIRYDWGKTAMEGSRDLYRMARDEVAEQMPKAEILEWWP